MDDECFAWQEFHDLPMAERIREFVQQKLSMARQLGMDFGEAIAMSDADDTVTIYTASQGTLTLLFGNRSKPAYRLVVRTNGTIKIDCTAEPPPLEDQIALMWRLPISLPERSAYGLVEQGGIQTIFIAGETTLIEGIYYPPGLNVYVRRDHSMLRTIRMPRDLDNEASERWLEQFCLSVKRGAIVRLGERIQQFPKDISVVWQNRQCLLLVEGSDGKQPPIVEGWYDFWHPREEYPGQLSLIDWGEADLKQPIRNWVV